MKLTLAKKDTPGSLVIHAERVRVFGGRVFYRRRVGAPEDEAPSGENVVVLISNDDPEVVPWVGSLLDRATGDLPAGQAANLTRRSGRWPAVHGCCMGLAAAASAPEPPPWLVVLGALCAVFVYVGGMGLLARFGGGLFQRRRKPDGGRGRKRMGGGALPAVVVVLSFLLTALVCAGFLSLPLAEVIGSHPDGADLARTALEMLLMTGACALCWCSGALAERRRLRRSRGWDHYRAPEL